MAQGGDFKTAGQTTGLILATVLGLAHGAQAQDAGGLNAQVSLSSGLSVSDDDNTNLQTDLGFDLTSDTRNQSFALSLGTGLQTDLDDGFSTRIADPTAALSYSIESRQTAITTELSYRQSDADDFVTDQDAPGILVLDEGMRETTATTLGLALGRDAKFGTDISLSYQDTAYSDSTSPDLIDQTNASAGVTFRFEIDPTITTTLAATWAQQDNANGRRVETQSLRAGASVAVNPALTAGVTVGTSRITTTQAATATVQDGVTYGLTLDADRLNGNLSFGLNSDLSETGRRTTATVGRTFETRSGAFAAQFGLSESRRDSLRPVLEVSYKEDLAQGNYSISFNQNFDTSNAGDETLNSRLQLDWQRDLTRTSRVGSNLTYQMSDVLGMDADSERLELGLRYSQDITEQWAWTTRFKHIQIDQDGAATERENEIFLGLETSFGWRP